MGVASHHSCHILLVRSSSQVGPTLKERGSYKGINTRKQRSLGVISVHHDEGEIKTFSNEWKLTEFIASRPAPQAILSEVHQVKKNHIDGQSFLQETMKVPENVNYVDKYKNIY